MKRLSLILLALTAVFVISCKEKHYEPRPTVPLVLSVAADSSYLGQIAANAGHVGSRGHIVLFGERSQTIRLSRRFQSVDRRDNIDGREMRDSLPDFAGEHIDAIMDVYNEPYSRLMRSSEGIDSLRTAAVQGALFAWDSLSMAKIIVFTSTLQASNGLFDVDTLQQLKGGVCKLMSPVHESLRAASAGGAKSIVVWASATVKDAKVYESVFNELGLEGSVSVITPEPALDICTEFRSILRQHRPSGKKMDAMIIDGFDLDIAPLMSEVALIRRCSTEEEEAFSNMLPSSFKIVEPDECIIDATFRLLRNENLFSHRIHRPVVDYYITEESLYGGLQKVPLSAQFVQSEYVQDIN